MNACATAVLKQYEENNGDEIRSSNEDALCDEE